MEGKLSDANPNVAKRGGGKLEGGRVRYTAFLAIIVALRVLGVLVVGFGIVRLLCVVVCVVLCVAGAYL